MVSFKNFVFVQSHVLRLGECLQNQFHAASSCDDRTHNSANNDDYNQ